MYYTLRSQSLFHELQVIWCQLIALTSALIILDIRKNFIQYLFIICLDVRPQTWVQVSEHLLRCLKTSHVQPRCTITICSLLHNILSKSKFYLTVFYPSFQQSVPSELTNGIIRRHIISVKAVDPYRSPDAKNFTTDTSLNFTIRQLFPWTKYNVSVQAFTIQAGPPSPWKQTRTLEAGKSGECSVL